MKGLAESIAATGEAIKQFQEEYLPAVRQPSGADPAEAPDGTASQQGPSAARHLELIQGLMDNMEQIKQMAGTASTRQTIPVRPESMADLSLGGTTLALALNDIPQSRVVAVAKAKLTQVDTVIRDIERMEKLLQ